MEEQMVEYKTSVSTGMTFQFKEVEPVTKKVTDPFANMISVGTKKIKISRLMKEQNLSGKFIKFYHDVKNQVIAMQFEDLKTDKNLVIHNSTNSTYVNLPVELQDAIRPYLHKGKQGNYNKNFHYFKHTNLWCFSYGKIQIE